jgi:hypothetical protein
MEFIKELIHHWDWELILRGICIEGPIIDVET